MATLALSLAPVRRRVRSGRLDHRRRHFAADRQPFVSRVPRSDRACRSPVSWCRSRRWADATRTRAVSRPAAAIGCLPWVHRKFVFYVLGSCCFSWSGCGATCRSACRRGNARSPARCSWCRRSRCWPRRGQRGARSRAANGGGCAALVSTMKHGLAGLWLDRQSGAAAPTRRCTGCVPVGWIITWRRTWPYLVPALLLYLPMASFLEWWGGFSPAARYLVPIMPLCLVPMPTRSRVHAVRYAAAILLLPQLAIDLVVWQHPRALWPARQRRELSARSSRRARPRVRAICFRFCGDGVEGWDG